MVAPTKYNKPTNQNLKSQQRKCHIALEVVICHGAAATVKLGIFHIDRRDLIFGVDPKMGAVGSAPAVRAEGKGLVSVVGDHLDGKSPTPGALLYGIGHMGC